MNTKNNKQEVYEVNNSGFYKLKNGDIVSLQDIFKAINYINSLDGIGSNEIPQGGWGNICGIIKGLIEGYSNKAEYLVNNIERQATREEVKKHLMKCFEVVKEEMTELIKNIKHDNQKSLQKLTQEEQKTLNECKSKEEDIEYMFNIFKNSDKSISIVVGVKMSLESLCTPLLVKNLIFVESPILIRKAIKILTWKESKDEDHIIENRYVKKSIWGSSLNRCASITDCVTGKYFEVKHRKRSRHARDDIDRIFREWARLQNAKDSIKLLKKEGNLNKIKNSLCFASNR
uniref:Uncharacterized protein n=1 Tax=viral metagenome TaxID=1070528 RepID=A0A6C0ACS2_9ZZZZ